ncbi:MAG: helix-turn-helix transcriptional regulator [Candidatus Odinarchaeota archaeon]
MLVRVIVHVTSVNNFLNDNRTSGAGSGNSTLILLILAVLVVLAIILSVTAFLLYSFMKQQKEKALKDFNGTVQPAISNITVDDSKKLSLSKPVQWERLDIEERAIVDILIQEEGNVLQKELSELTSFSKSTITRILNRLEEQDLVYRTPAGRGYRVFLKEKQSNLE